MKRAQDGGSVQGPNRLEIRRKGTDRASQSPAQNQAGHSNPAQSASRPLPLGQTQASCGASQYRGFVQDLGTRAGGWMMPFLDRLDCVVRQGKVSCTAGSTCCDETNSSAFEMHCL